MDVLGVIRRTALLLLNGAIISSLFSRTISGIFKGTVLFYVFFKIGEVVKDILSARSQRKRKIFEEKKLSLERKYKNELILKRSELDLLEKTLENSQNLNIPDEIKTDITSNESFDKNSDSTTTPHEKEIVEVEFKVAQRKKSWLRVAFDVVYLFFSSLSPTYNLYEI